MGFKVGDKVHVEFDAVVTKDLEFVQGRLCTYTLKETDSLPGYNGTIHYVYLHGDNATVIDPQPENWPPQAGDIWEVEGYEYFVYDGFLGTTIYPFTDNFAAGGVVKSYSLSDIDAKFKALKPTLVRRSKAR